MGIRGLLPFLRKRCPQVIQPVSIDAFRGKRIALDGFLLLQKTFRSSYDEASAIAAWHNLLVSLRHLDIDLICVFDGPSRPKLKLRELARRQHARWQADARVTLERSVSEHLVKLSDAVRLPIAERTESLRSSIGQLREAMTRPLPKPDIIEDEAAPMPAFTIHREQRSMVQQLETALQEYEIAPESNIGQLSASLAAMSLRSQTREAQLQRLSQPLPWQFIAAGKNMVRALGIPTYQPTAEVEREAEEIAASFALSGEAAVVASEDTDVLVHGASLLMGMAFHESANQPLGQLVLIDPTDVREALGLNEPNWVDFSILCGSDYPGHIMYVGPVTGLALLKQHGSIPQLLEHLLAKKHRGAVLLNLSTYHEELAKTRDIFLDKMPPPLVDLASVERDEKEVERLLALFDIPVVDQQQRLETVTFVQ